MMLTDFDELLAESRRQTEPQRLLFVFVRTELPDAATEDQRDRHQRREGGTLSPLLCVDKLPSDIASFRALHDESRRTAIDWDLVFVAALDGRGGVAPSEDEAAQPLRLMVNAINNGQINTFAAFDRDGHPVQFY